MIEFHLLSRSGVAPYLQLIQQVRGALRLGLLEEGDRLPTVKEVSGALAINPNTVLKAYRELEYEGLVAARLGKRYDHSCGGRARARQAVRALLGVVGLHADHPGRTRRRSCRPERRRQTTLLSLMIGMLAPTAGSIEILGAAPPNSPEQLARIGYVAQDAPTYGALSVADRLRFGARTNPGWDGALAAQRIRELGPDPRQKAGKLSGGQRASSR